GMSRPDDVMIGSQMRRHFALELAFIKLLITESNRKSHQPILCVPANHRRNRRGIESSAQISPDRHIGPQANPACINQQLPKFFYYLFKRVLSGMALLCRKMVLPILFNSNRLPIGHQEMSRRQFLDPAKNSIGTQRRPESENLFNDLGIDLRSDSPVAENRFD